MIAFVQDLPEPHQRARLAALERAGVRVHLVAVGAQPAARDVRGHSALAVIGDDALVAEVAARLDPGARLLAIDPRADAATLAGRLAAFEQRRTLASPLPLLRVEAAALPAARFASSVCAGAAAALAEGRADADQRQTRLGRAAALVRAVASAADALRRTTDAAATTLVRLDDDPAAPRAARAVDVRPGTDGVLVHTAAADAQLATALRGAARAQPAACVELVGERLLVDAHPLHFAAPASVLVSRAPTATIER